MLALVTQFRTRERAVEPESATPQAARRPAPHAMLLSLQRTAGNAAVGRLLARTPQQDTVTAMKATKGYGALSGAEKTRIDTLIGGSTSVSARAGRQAAPGRADHGAHRRPAARDPPVRGRRRAAALDVPARGVTQPAAAWTLP
jgi:hypothetical protein